MAHSFEPIPSGARIADFDRQLETLPPHRRPGFLDSFCAVTMRAVVRELTPTDGGGPSDRFDRIERPYSNPDNPLPYVVATQGLADLLEKWDTKGRFTDQAARARTMQQRAELACILRAGLDEFTLDELHLLRNGTDEELGRDMDLLSRYGVGVFAGTVSPYDFFLLGKNFQENTAPGSVLDGDALRARVLPRGDGRYRATAEDLCLESAEGIAAGGAVTQTYRMPDGRFVDARIQTTKFVRRGPVISTVSLVPHDAPNEIITISPEDEALQGYSTVQFERWLTRSLGRNESPWQTDTRGLGIISEVLFMRDTQM